MRCASHAEAQTASAVRRSVNARAATPAEKRRVPAACGSAAASVCRACARKQRRPRRAALRAALPEKYVENGARRRRQRARCRGGSDPESAVHSRQIARAVTKRACGAASSMQRVYARHGMLRRDALCSSARVPAREVLQSAMRYVSVRRAGAARRGKRCRGKKGKPAACRDDAARAQALSQSAWRHVAAHALPRAARLYRQQTTSVCADAQCAMPRASR